ncbi:fungal-specific transcription factor domain-containing protein [Infundibulicybe gibba]|nr:fungal-specific transcription factor domain-containing protein [Infundibulicybe gibba]
MDPFDRSRNNNPVSSTHQSSFSFLTNNNTYPADETRTPPQNEDERQDANAPLVKGPKRKRLAKACDACHKSKRRCDGTSPCSNCFYASKNCTYTDASGRPVPAPRPPRADRIDPTSSSNTTNSRPTQPAQYNMPQFPSPPDASHFPQHNHSANGYPAPAGPSISKADSDEEERNRKRFRNERGNPVPAEEIIVEGPVTIERPARVELDPSLARELTNLFFTHCHPARAIIHKPTFSAALSHNSVPSYLLHAICALAAPLSKQSRIRTNPVRFAGKPFAKEALSIMFDGAGRLVCELNLETAQALCLLQIHDVLTKDANMLWILDLALQIVETLGVHSPEHPTLTPVPSPEFIQASIEREAVRRIFWLIHLLDVISSIYFKKSSPYTDTGLRLRLPADETSFEMGVHSTLPEYLYLPAVRTQYASEFGHLIRIVTIYSKLELALDDMNESEPTAGGSASAALTEGEKAMEEWSNSLPEQLQFSQESLEQQRSMFETPSNMGAWCWCCMHVYHASCGLALNLAKQRLHRGPASEPHWATKILEMVLEMLGDRAKYSSFIKYCKRDDQLVRGWCADYEETWGTRIRDLIVDSQPPTSPQHPFPSTSQQTHNRRVADARQNPHHPGPHQPPHQHGGDVTYTNRRSPTSVSPNGHALGRPTDEFRTQVPNSSNHNSVHRVSPHSQPVLDEREKPDGGFSGTNTGSAGGGVSGVSANQRGHGAEGSQSLPSLKASGLLDWNHANSSQRSPRRSPPSHSVNPDSELRPATLGMPVGLPWLANESR